MIFLCYCRADHLLALQLMHKLRAQGETIECDPPLVQGDAFWREKVWMLLQRCSKMIVLWSQAAATSPWVDQEIRAFAGPVQFCVVSQPALVPEECYAVPLETIPAAHFQLSEPSHTQGAYVFPPATVEKVRRERQQQIEQETRRLQNFRKTCEGEPRPCFHAHADTLCLTDGSLLKNIRSNRSSQEKTHRFLLTSPVTNRHYRRFVQSTSYPPPPTWTRQEFQLPDAPVTGVTWFEAQAYAAWVGGELPDETDWEWAATTGSPFCTSAAQSDRLTGAEVIFNQPFIGAAPVSISQCLPNPFGFFCLCGNVWEWCADSWGKHRVLRGGGYMDSARFCHVGARYRNAPIDRDCCVGFRVTIPVSVE
jgi:hypothetical protein